MYCGMYAYNKPRVTFENGPGAFIVSQKLFAAGGEWTHTLAW